MLGVTLLCPWRVFLPNPVAACLRLSPDRSQFFRYDSLSLSCESQNTSTSGWKVQKKPSEGRVRPCPTTDSTCVIRNAYPIDSGVYFCQSEGGQISNGVNITVTDRSVLLESPALPVSEGAAVTLRCRIKLNSSSRTFHFYRDGSKVHSSSDGEMMFPHTSKSDEGLYKCSAAGGEESESSWLAVQAAPSTSPSTPHPRVPSASLSVLRLSCHLVVAAPYLLSTILLGFIYRDRKTGGSQPSQRHQPLGAGSHSGEIDR